MSAHHGRHGRKHRGTEDNNYPGCIKNTKCGTKPNSCFVPSDPREHWPTLSVIPYPEPDPDDEQQHRLWRREYKKWIGICQCPCGMGYFCRRHGQWIQGNEVKDEFQKERDEFGYPECPERHESWREPHAENELLDILDDLRLDAQHSLQEADYQNTGFYRKQGQAIDPVSWTNEYEQHDPTYYSSPRPEASTDDARRSLSPTYSQHSERASVSSSKKRHSTSYATTDPAGTTTKYKSKSHRSHEKGHRSKKSSQSSSSALPNNMYEHQEDRETLPEEGQAIYNNRAATSSHGRETAYHQGTSPQYQSYGPSDQPQISYEDFQQEKGRYRESGGKDIDYGQPKDYSGYRGR